MGHYARGDSRKMICSSDEEEGYRTQSRHSSRANSMISQMNITDKRNLIFGTFGEAPPVPLPPVSDDADRQFWAEDELSSSESRNTMIPKRKRRHSVAYRNRAAIRRSRSEFAQSSSSGAEAARLKIPPSVRRKQKLRNCPATSRVQRARVSSGGAQPKINTRAVTRLLATGGNSTANREILGTVAQDQRFRASVSSRGTNETTADAVAPSTENANPSRTPSKSDSCNARRSRVSKLRLLSKPRRK